MSLSAHEELLMLRKRARRRLIGAIVLVGFAVLVLWNVLEKLPQQEMKPPFGKSAVSNRRRELDVERARYCRASAQCGRPCLRVSSREAYF